MSKRWGEKWDPRNPQTYPKVHGRKPKAPPPHRSNGKACRLGQVIGAVVLGMLLVGMGLGAFA